MKSFPIICHLLPLIGLIASSCSSQSQSSTAGKSKAAGTQVTSTILTSASTPKVLSIGTACALAVSHHPSMATYPMDRRAADARILKATRLPNPELSFDAEDFFGTGGTSGLSSSVLNAILSQVVERGGKREARTDAARSDGAVMNAEYELKRLELIQKTGELYIDAVVAHENCSFLQAALDRSRETLRLVTRLSDVGRVTRSAVQQADLEVQKMELEIASAKKTRQMASQALTAQWGDKRSSIFTGTGLGSPPGNLVSKASVQSGLAEHPGINLAQAKIAQAEANLQLAKSGRYRDIVVGGGTRRDNSSDESSGLLAILIPLRIFDKGQDGINEMAALLEKTKAEAEGEKRQLDTGFLLAWSELISDHEAAQRVKDHLLPLPHCLFLFPAIFAGGDSLSHQPRTRSRRAPRPDDRACRRAHCRGRRRGDVPDYHRPGQNSLCLQLFRGSD